MRAKRPTVEQVDIAVLWLRVNEGEDGESEACAAVADWLLSEASERALREIARKAGVPVARARETLAKLEAEL